MQSNMDGEFEPICSGLLGLFITPDTVSRDEHVPESERNVRTVKDRVRSVLNSLPFRKISDCMVIDIFLGQVFWLNVFPDKYRVSKTMGPHQIISGLKIDYHCQCCIAYGQYVQTHEQHGKNMMYPTLGAIELPTTGNRKCGYYFYCILTVRCLNRCSWTELPILNESIQRIEKMSRRCDHGNNFIYCDGTSILDNEDADDRGQLIKMN